MRFAFIPTQYSGKVDFSRIDLNKLPGRIGLVTTAQFMGKTGEIKQYLEENGKEALLSRGRQRNDAQLLGCDQGAALNMQEKVDAFLYIGSGDFHPMGVAMKTDKKVYLFNPVSSVFEEFDKKKIDDYQKAKRINYSKFLNAQNIGIMVSTKPGQYSFKQAQNIKKKLEEKGKNCYVFVFDTLEAHEMRNFPFIDFWVNTACPRIADDRDKSKVVDMSELQLE